MSVTSRQSVASGASRLRWCLVGTERAEKVGGIGYEGDGSAKQDCGGWDAGGRLALRLAF